MSFLLQEHLYHVQHYHKLAEQEHTRALEGREGEGRGRGRGGGGGGGGEGRGGVVNNMYMCSPPPLPSVPLASLLGTGTFQTA